MLTISGKSLGSRKPLFADFSLPPPAPLLDGGEPLRLRDLIEHTVRVEVAAYEKRQEARRLDRVLSASEIAEAAERGKINPEGRDPKHEQRPVDVEAAAQTALEAFEDGLYLVIIDEVEYRELDAIISLTEDSRVTFVRLTFLAGA
jgi:hypothetical protein